MNNMHAPALGAKKTIMRRLSDMANTLEPDRARAYHWMVSGKLQALNGKTPVEAVYDGEGEQVVQLLEQFGRGLMTNAGGPVEERGESAARP